MPKRKTKVVRLRLKQNKSLVPKIILGVVGIIGLVGIYFFSTRQKTSINLIAEGGPAITCSTVSAISYSGICGDGLYQSISFTCGSTGATNTLGGGSDSCQTFTTWYSEAKATCQRACPSPTPRPSSPSPTGTFLYDTTDPNLVAYWPMDEATDNTCSDGTSDVCDRKGGSDGSATGAQVVNGIFSHARQFNGTSNYINLPAKSTHFGSFTYEAWINLSIDVRGDKVILCEGNTTGGCYQKFFVAANGKLAASIDANGTNHYSNYALPVNVWTHVAMTYEGISHKLTLYVNGIAQSDVGTQTPTFTGSAIRIGARTTTPPAIFFEGSIDEVRIYGEAVSSQTLKDHYYRAFSVGNPQGTSQPVPTSFPAPPSPSLVPAN